MLIQHVPASRLAITRWARWMSRVKTPAASPNWVALARATTSCSSSKASTHITGPKISSRAIRIESRTSVEHGGLHEAAIGEAGHRPHPAGDAARPRRAGRM